MPVLEYKQTRVTQEDVRNPRDPWINYRKVRLASSNLESVTDAELSRWLEQVGSYVESIEAGNCFGDFFQRMDRISLFGPQFARTPCLVELTARMPLSAAAQNPPPAAGCNTLGDMLLFALTNAPVLEKLELSRFSFSSPLTVERFLGGSKTLSHLSLANVKAIGKDTMSMEAVCRGFRRGFERNQTLTSISVQFFKRGENEEFLLAEILQGLMLKSIEELRLGIRGPVSNHALTVLRLLLAGLSNLRKLYMMGNIAHIGLFQGLASSTASIDKLNIETYDCELLADSSTDRRIASAIREWNGGSATHNKAIIKTLVCDCSAFGPQAGAALTDGIGRMMMDGTLENLDVYSNALPSHDLILRRIGRLRTVHLGNLHITNWPALLEYTSQFQQGCMLTKFELIRTTLSVDNLRVLLQFLSRIKCLETVSLYSCGITAEAAVFVVGLIQQSGLKQLVLTDNSVGAQGATTIMDATRDSASLEWLDIGGSGTDIVVDDCHESLRGALIGSQLISLRLDSSTPMGQESVTSLAQGVSQNTTLKELYVPYINPVNLLLLGGSLVQNSVLEIFGIGEDENLELDEQERPLFVEAEEAEEQAMCAFIDLIPQMKGLKKLRNLFDRKPTNRLMERAIAAMRLNTSLEEVSFDKMESVSPKYLFGNETVQYYLELNRFRRRQYLEKIGDSKLPNNLLPLILAKMTRPEFSNHLYYFLRHGAGLLQSPDEASSSLKRKAASSPGRD